MNEPSDPYWDELGVAWSAIDPNIRVTASQLEVRLRRQSQWMAAAIVVGMVLGALGLVLGLATIAMGVNSGAWNFVTRGAGIIAISAILMFAVWSLQPIRSVDATCALLQMIDLAIERARKTLSLIRAGLYSCVIAAVFGLAGTAIRAHFGRPPKLSPIVDLLILGVVALVLVLGHWRTRRELRNYLTLKQAVAVGGAV
jgi:ABC-type multidrug transport system fused ATPase/permease subunit